MSFTVLKGVESAAQSKLTSQIEFGLQTYLQWGLLGAGYFQNISRPTSGIYGGDFARLHPVNNEQGTSGTVWGGGRSDWVWESGVSYQTQPIQISGVYVNDEFYPSSTTGAYAHYVNYPHGQIVFTTPVSGTVECEHSFRHVHVTTPDAPWWRRFQRESYRIDSDNRMTGSGLYNLFAQSRVQLPAILIEGATNFKATPFEIGTSNPTVKQSVLFHIFAEHRDDLTDLHDVITAQWAKRIQGIDKNAMMSSGWMPLNYLGSLESGATCYPDWVERAKWRLMRIEDVSSTGGQDDYLQYARVKAVISIDSPY